MTIKCILFDADGVVINSEMFSVQYQKKYRVSNEAMISFFKGEFQDCIIGKADLKKLIKPWLPKWKWKGNVDDLLQYWFKAEHNIDECIIKIIQKLRKKGIKCYLATNQEKYRTNYIKNQMGFKKLFDDIFSSADIGYKKPNKEFYEFILNKIKNDHNIYPHEIMYFDDSQEEVDKAKRLDIDAHFYKNFKKFKSIIKPLLKNSI